MLTIGDLLWVRMGDPLCSGWETHCGSGDQGQSSGLPLLLDMQLVPDGPSWHIVSFWHLAGFETNSLQALTLKHFMPVTLILVR